MGEERPTVARGEKVCPACGGKLVPIMYGLPSSEGFQAAERGEYVLGGCIVSGDDPQFECAACHEQYYVEKP
ncbi:MAG TPA: hypothetical protein VFS19_04570 [Planctomycetota bacterium]|nr:hypothetical protein [Planctomycetota bacterium]